MGLNPPINKIRGWLAPQTLIRDTLATTGWSAAGKTVGFLIPFFIASWFGISGETDAFFFAYGLILFVAAIFAPVFEGIIVPFIAEIRARNGDIGRFVGGLLTAGGAILMALTGVLLVLARPLLSRVTRFDESSLDIICRVLLETAPLVILLAWSGILAGSLNAFKKFRWPAVSPAFRAAICLAVIYLGKGRLGVHSIAGGYIAGEAAHLVVLYLAIRRFGLFTIIPALLPSREVLNFFRTASFQATGMVAAAFVPVVDRTMASWLGEGSVSVLYYADRLYMVPVTFMTAGLIVTLLSHWSENHYRSEGGRLKTEVGRAVRWVGVIALAATALSILVRMPVIRLVFRGETATPAQISEIARVLLFYLLGYLPYILGRIYVRAHLVLKNTRPLMISAFFLIGINIILNYLLMRVLGTAGIALATTIASVFSLAYLSSAFYRTLSRMAGERSREKP